MVNLTIYLAAAYNFTNIYIRSDHFEVKQFTWSMCNMEIINKNKIRMDIFYIEVYLYDS